MSALSSSGQADAWKAARVEKLDHETTIISTRIGHLRIADLVRPSQGSPSRLSTAFLGINQASLMVIG
jgi:hypothetical protein